MHEGCTLAYMRRTIALIATCLAAVIGLAACQPPTGGGPPPPKPPRTTEVFIIMRKGEITVWGTNVEDIGATAREGHCTGTVYEATWTGGPGIAKAWPFKLDTGGTIIALDFAQPYGPTAACDWGDD